MRALLAAAIAAAAMTTFAPAAQATCMPHSDNVLFYSYSCSPPGGPVTTYYCFRPTNQCWSHTSGEGGPVTR